MKASWSGSPSTQVPTSLASFLLLCSKAKIWGSQRCFCFRNVSENSLCIVQAYLCLRQKRLYMHRKSQNDHNGNFLLVNVNVRYWQWGYSDDFLLFVQQPPFLFRYLLFFNQESQNVSLNQKTKSLSSNDI